MSISLAFTLLFAVAQDDPLESARIAYSNCLADIAIEHLNNRASKKDFDNAAKSACQNEKRAYSNAVTAEELSMDASQADAKAFADEETSSVLKSWSDSYKDLKETDTLPVKE